MSPRPTLLLLLAGALALVAAARFETAVHPEEVIEPGPYASYREAVAQVPALDAVRVHEAMHVHDSDPGVAFRLRKARGSGGFARVTDVAAVQSQLGRGRLAARSVPELKELARRLKAGEVPPDVQDLPPVPDIQPYYRDALGPYPCEVILRRTDALDTIEAAAPEATLRGEPVLRRAEERRRGPLTRAVVTLLVALTLWHAVLAARAARVAGAVTETVERRLLAMLLALGVLGWSGLGVDTASLLALALVAAVPAGAPLLAGAPLVFFPVAALQRIGLVLLCGALIRKRLRRPEGAERAGPAGWIGALGMGMICLFALWPAEAATQTMGDAAAWFAPAGARSAADETLRARGFTDILGGETFPAVEAGDARASRQLGLIYRTAGRRLKTAPPEERALLEQVQEAAARDGVIVPASLRQRRETLDGRAVLWVFDPGNGDTDGLESSSLYRMRTKRALRSSAGLAAALVFVLAALLRARRGADHLLRDLAVAGLVFAGGVAWFRAVEATGWGGGVDLLLPVMAIAAFSATWGLVFAVGALALILPAEFAAHSGAFVLAAGVHYLARRWSR